MCVCVPQEPTVSYINSSTCAVEYSVSLISDQCVCVPQEPTVSSINSSACAVEYSDFRPVCVSSTSPPRNSEFPGDSKLGCVIRSP